MKWYIKQILHYDKPVVAKRESDRQVLILVPAHPYEEDKPQLYSWFNLTNGELNDLRFKNVEAAITHIERCGFIVMNAEFKIPGGY
jgi:hypothetical protein